MSVATAALLLLLSVPALDYAEREVVKATKDQATRDFLRLAIQKNLDEKAAAKFPLTEEETRRTVVDYEIFKLQTYLGAGVFPKKYFGYFDEKWDTAAYEVTLRETTRRAAELINARQKKRGARTDVTEAEIAVTFISEGGAILLREHQAQLEQIHPVFGVGLDDIAIGFPQYADLLETLDRELQTDLRGIVVDGGLRRHMTFKEAILGTAVMWIYEKELAARKLYTRDQTILADRPRDEQFIIGSLVYNSGILFAEERVQAIKHFRTADYLAAVSKATADRRPELPLFARRDRLPQLLSDDYPLQPTSWNAAYHILQRYGGFVALHRFSKTFDANGKFR